MDFDVLPCYVLCDMSYSMTDHLDEVNAELTEFIGGGHTDPSVAARIRVCVIGFAETPRLLQPLCSLSAVTGLTGLNPCTGSNFGPVFALLREIIDHDVRELKAERLQVHRPIVFFTSDGRPADQVAWPVAFAALIDPAWRAHPNVVAFGAGAADQGTLSRIGTFRLFLARDGIRMSTALSVSLAGTAPQPDHV